MNQQLIPLAGRVTQHSHYGPEWAHPSGQPMPRLELLLLSAVLELVNPSGLLRVLEPELLVPAVQFSG